MTNDATAGRAAYLLAAFLVLVGGILRFQQAWSCRAVYLPDSIPEEGYYDVGIGLLSYQSFGVGVPNAQPRAWRGPIYPVFIALIESLHPEPDPGRVRLVQAALASLSILLVFALGTAIYSPAAGLLGAALLAFSADQAEAVTSLNIHEFYSYLLLTACAALVLWSERLTAKTTVMAGAFIGFTLLCRSAHFLLVPFLAATAWFWRPLPGPRWRAPAFLVLGVALALAPMTARDYVVAKRWLPFPDTFAGAVALFGATTGHQGIESYTVQQALELAEAAEPGFSRSFPNGDLHASILDLALRRIADAPVRFAGLCLVRLGLLGREFWLPLTLGLAGLALQRRNRRLQIAVMLAFSFSGYCVAGGDAQHQAAAMPVLFLLSGCGGAVIIDRLRGVVPVAHSITKSWLRSILAAGPIFGLFLYAVFLFALAAEARQRLWYGNEPSLAREDRALAILRRRAEQRREPSRKWYVAALTKSARLWSEAGDCAKAVPKLRLSLLLEPRQPMAAGALAACLADEGDANSTRSLIAAALAKISRMDLSPLQRRHLAGAYASSGDFKHALEHLNALPGAANDIDTLIEKARARAELGQKETASTLIGKAARMRSDHEQKHRIAMIYQDIGEYARAVRILRELTADRPDNPNFFVSRGVCEYLLGSIEQAEASLKSAVQLDPKFLPAYLSLGYIYDAQKRYQQALDVYSRALAASRENPNNAERQAIMLALQSTKNKAAAARR